MRNDKLGNPLAGSFSATIAGLGKPAYKIGVELVVGRVPPRGAASHKQSITKAVTTLKSFVSKLFGGGKKK